MGWKWGTPRKDMGPVEELWDGDGVPHWVWTNKQTETVTFPHPSEAGGNKRKSSRVNAGGIPPASHICRGVPLVLPGGRGTPGPVWSGGSGSLG